MIILKNNKIVLEPSEIKYLQDNYLKMTNKELAAAIGLRLSKLRYFLYKLDLKRMTLEYWTSDQVQFLKDNYKTIGDTEIAKIFQEKYVKEKGWSLKHIEKKRRSLKLKRTEIELLNIKQRNIKRGCWENSQSWRRIAEAAIGTKKVWFSSLGNPIVVIKEKGGFVHYNRHLWKKTNGPIPPGMVVRNTSPDKINFTGNDLILLSKSENAKMNHDFKLPKELREIQNAINKLNSIIQNSKKDDNRSKQ